MEAFYSDEFIGIAVHNADPMTVAEYDSGVGFQSFPNGIINRRIELPPSRFKDGLDLVSEEISPLAITIAASVDEEDRMMSATITTESVTQLTDRNYKLSVIVTEDGVTGTTEDYDQVNQFSGLPAGTLVGVDGVDWTTLPDPVLAADMVYDHVGRALLGGFDGVSDALSDDIRAGDIFTQEESIENGWVEVGSVSTYEESLYNIVHVYPNPVIDYVNVKVNLSTKTDVSLELIDVTAKSIMSKLYNNQNGLFSTIINTQSVAAGNHILKNYSRRKFYH